MVIQTLSAVSFALGTAILWGLAPVLAKKGLNRGGTTVQAATVSILTTGVIVWVALLFTEGSSMFQDFTPIDFGIFLLGGLVGTTLGRLSLYAGVRRVGASVSTGVMNTRPLFSVVLAYTFLQENVSLISGVGVLLLALGVLALSLAKGGDIRGWRTPELAFPLAAAAAYASGNVLRRFGFLTTPASLFEALTLNETAAILTLGAYLVVFRRDQIRSANRASIRFFVVSGAISGLGLISFFQALSIGEVSTVDPITGMSPLFATAFTYALLRETERVTSGVILGASLIVIGGAMVTL